MKSRQPVLREKPGRADCADCQRPFEAGIYAKYCLRCRWKYRGRRKKYVWTPERDDLMRRRYDGSKGCGVAIAATLGWPKWVISRRACVLGLARRPKPGRPWTAQEEAFLEEHAGTRHLTWLCRKLGRSAASVALKFKRMGISRAIREGYTMRDLEQCFGMDHRAIERWVREGKLVARRRFGGKAPAFERDAWKFDDEDLVRFIVENPMAFRLDKVDQLWFMDLVAGGGLLRRALRMVEGAA